MYNFHCQNFVTWKVFYIFILNKDNQYMQKEGWLLGDSLKK